MTTPIAFSFAPSFNVRVVTRNDDPWFVAKDVAEALDYTWNATKTIGHVPEEWRGVESVSTPQKNQHGSQGEQVQDLAVLSEQGLYFFLGRSDKPKALPFQKWLAGEVLPAIRKTGKYELPQPPAVAPELLSNRDMDNLTRIVWLTARQFRFEQSWSNAVWKRIRIATGTPSPQKFQVQHLPIIAAELRKIYTYTNQVRSAMQQAEKEAIKRVLLKCEDAATVLADITSEMDKAVNETHIEFRAKLDPWEEREFALAFGPQQGALPLGKAA